MDEETKSVRQLKAGLELDAAVRQSFPGQLHRASPICKKSPWKAMISHLAVIFSEPDYGLVCSSKTDSHSSA